MKLFFKTLVLLTPVLLFASCGKGEADNPAPAPAPANPTNTTTENSTEVWGASGVEMRISGNTTTMQFNCAHAQIDVPLNPDATGHFDVPGFYFFEDGRSANKVVARFTGTISGDSMRITVAPCGSSVRIFTLTRGQTGTLTNRCVQPVPVPPAPPVSHVAKVGEWGGEHIDMMVSATGATYQLDCGHGTIDQNISPNQTTGRFHNTGTFTREGGPTPAPTVPNPSVPAVYDGTINNNTMDLTITTTVGGNLSVSNFRLFFGQHGHLVRCL